MRDRTINQLTELADGSVATGDMLPVYDVSASGTRYALVSSLARAIATAFRSITDAVFAWGTTVTTGAASGDVVLKNTAAIRGVNAGGDTALTMIRVDANNVVQLGQPASGVYTAVGAKAAADLPAGGSNNSGVLLVDTANGRLIYYVGANRYYLTGTSF